MSRYKTAPRFKEWETPGKSSMLLLVGSNYEGVMELRHHCWMSPLALDLIDHFSASSEIHAFYAFNLFGRTRMYVAVSEILFQLLRWKRRELGSGDYFATLSAVLRKYHSIDVNADEEAKFETLCHVAVTIMQLFKPDETVYIGLDRIDRYKGNERIDFLNTLIDIIEEAVSSVKILAVANKTGWDVEERELKRRKRSQFEQVVERQKLQLDKA